jgi:uncharacterized protein YdhG (YjbR/CyaY superfamily)
MAEAKKAANRTTKAAAKAESGYEGFSEEEREAMKDHAKELKSASRSGSKAAKAAEEAAAVVEKIAQLPDADRVLAERIHDLVAQHAPELAPRLWYGMPAYAKDGKIVCHFQSAQKFKTRYATLGFSDAAQLDDGALWPVAYALTELNAAAERQIAALIKQAAG